MSDEQPDIEFSFTFTPEFIRNGLKRDLIWRLVLMVAAVLVVAATVGWVLGVPPWRTPVLPALIAGVVAGCIVVPMKFRSMVKTTFQRWTLQSPEHVVTYRLFPEVIEVIMPNARSRHAWRDLRSLWRYHDVWLLEVVKLQSILFPVDAPEEAKEYILARCTEAGIRT